MIGTTSLVAILVGICLIEGSSDRKPKRIIRLSIYAFFLIVRVSRVRSGEMSILCPAGGT